MVLDYAPTSTTTASQIYTAFWNKQFGSTTVFERILPSLTEITRFYSIKTPDKVRRFLTTHDFLRPFLIDAIESLRQYFPDNTLVLSVQTDPDTCVQNLILSIDIQNDPDQAMQGLDQMDTGWWFTVSPKIRDLVLITLSAG
jgi:hypothetical protein